MAADPNRLSAAADSTTETFSLILRFPRGFRLSLVKEVRAPAVFDDTISFDAVTIVSRTLETRQSWGLDMLNGADRTAWPTRQLEQWERVSAADTAGWTEPAAEA